MFTYDQVCCFCAVYENGSYSAGARKLRRDRSTVREHIAAMEDTIGVPLFDIVGKSATPTETAHKLYPRALVINHQLREFSAEAATSFDDELSSVNIYYDAMIPTSLIAEVETKVADVFPHVRFHWLLRNRQEAITDLSNNKAHLALMPVLNRVLPEGPVIFTNLGAMRFGVYVGTQSPLANKTQVQLSDLQLEKQYIVENHYLAELPNSKVSPHYHLVSSNDVLICLLKRQGWAVLPEETARQYEAVSDIQRIEVKELVSNYNVNICTFHTPSGERNPIITLLKEVINDYAKKHLF
ncbi:LysR family transcriptional regulator [Vibrio hannami]|uniref:LysR family transcriptional regulator n=1 Tax=Vibrio hannami TaxID=2717094 RepID=UPI00240F4ABC|nr:LysR family transcriptional regulator [Vibrio hannami]MDG3085499.1 LysR family transcriptional regulator [Vibrio hannami]